MITLNAANISQTNNINTEKNAINIETNKQPIFKVDFSEKISNGVLWKKLNDFDRQVTEKSSGFINSIKNKLFEGRKEALIQARELINDIKDGKTSDLDEISGRVGELLTGAAYYSKHNSQGEKNRSALLQNFQNEIGNIKNINGNSGSQENLFYGLKLAREAASGQNNEQAINSFVFWAGKNNKACNELFSRIYSEDGSKKLCPSKWHLGFRGYDKEADFRGYDKEADKQRDIEIPKEVFKWLQKVLVETAVRDIVKDENVDVDPFS